MKNAIERTKVLLYDCDCPACTAASTVLEVKDEILK